MIQSWIRKLSKTRSRQGLYEFLHVEFGKIKAGESVLTVGSGGQINELLNRYSERQNFDVVSFDVDDTRGPDIVGDICTYDFEGRTFDTVVICEVLEHLYAPHMGIETVFSILKPGGKLVLTTPFVLPLHDRPYDYFRFTKYGLMHLLEKFSDVNVKERNSYFEAIDVLWVRLLKVKAKRSFLLSLVIIPWVYFINRPFTLLLSKILDTDALTTGYNVSAIKN